LAKIGRIAWQDCRHQAPSAGWFHGRNRAEPMGGSGWVGTFGVVSGGTEMDVHCTK